jgi:hypothetical protein
MKDKLTEDFLQSLKESEPILFALQFKPYSFFEKGPAYYIKYKREITGSIVEFIFGPTDWMVEMIIFTKKGKFEFKDLYEIPAIVKWISNNRYIYKEERDIKTEILYFIDLLKISLPLVE